MHAQIAVLLIEDNRLLRDAIAQLLASQPDIALVGAAASGEAALRESHDKTTHVVLVDLGLKDDDSVRLVRELKKATPDVRVIAMDLFPVHEDVVELVEAGVSGFILKDATPADFMNTIRAVAGGSHVLPPPLTDSLFSQIARQAAGRGTRAVIDAVRLTQRERQVIDLIGEGLSNKEIAHRLHIATHTVKSHVHNILEKLALHTRLQIAAFARAEGAD
ncbi:MAG: DNA-binding response regulator [Gemmatimonadetes bacterium]|nr:MAG: DNA-binding response regulator [Gemmatimonadota bacterium]